MSRDSNKLWSLILAILIIAAGVGLPIILTKVAVSMLAWVAAMALSSMPTTQSAKLQLLTSKRLPIKWRAKIWTSSLLDQPGNSLEVDHHNLTSSQLRKDRFNPQLIIVEMCQCKMFLAEKLRFQANKMK